MLRAARVWNLGKKVCWHVGFHFSMETPARTVIHLGMQFLILKFPKQLPDPADQGQRRNPWTPKAPEGSC